MLRFMIILAYCTGSNINCLDLSCSSCVSGYLYNSLSCLPICPSGYTQSSSPNICTPASQSIFYLNFWEFRDFGASSIGGFNHPSLVAFQDVYRGSPIPTNERGFYFVTTSRLISSINYIIGPDFTLRFCIKIKSDGAIFEAYSQTTSYFKLESLSGTVTANWYLTSLSTSSTFSLPSFSYTNSWVTVVMYSSQSSGLFTMYMNGHQSTVTGFEFRGQVADLLCYFGGAAPGGSYTGFLYEMHADNLVTTSYLLAAPSIACEYNEYFSLSTGTCQACTGCTETWPWCARSACSVCYSTSCATCTGFGYSFCDSCVDSVNHIAPNCVLGLHCTAGSGVFSCTSCSSGYTLVDGLCLVQPYGYIAGATAAVVDMNFNTFAKFYGGIFQSGSNDATWGPFQSPEVDDPIPAKSRGLYFDGVAMFLVSNTILALNYKSSIAMWVYPKGGAMLLCNNMFSFYRMNAGIYISNPDGSWFSYTYDINYENDSWIFKAYTLDFVSDTFTLTYTEGTTATKALSVNGYAFYDYPSVMYIGQYLTQSYNHYQGFIYSITIWQRVVTDFSSYYDTCGSGLGSSCLWACDLTQYYNSYEGIYQNCDTGCSTGCRSWGSCSKCQNFNCGSCNSFTTSNCLLLASSPCDSGYVLDPTGSSCCDSACAECFGPELYNCKTCNSGRFLLSNICVSACPLGYKVVSSTCVEHNDPYISLMLDQIQECQYTVYILESHWG